MTSDRPVRVMLCDDSATVRAAMARVLEMSGIRVVARAENGADALVQIRSIPEADRPHVVLLDLEMPVMDGMTVLPQLLKLQPRPAVIVASALTQRGAESAMAALRAGAVDYIPKPSAADGGIHAPAFREELSAKVSGWARMVRIQALPATRSRTEIRLRSLKAPRVIGLGSSTGGPQALATLVRHLPKDLPAPILAVQHMPAGFTTMLADHLHRLGGPACIEARDGERLEPGRIHLAPGSSHLLFDPGMGQPRARLVDTPPENFCRPAVDPLLRSLVAGCDGDVLAVILTGMGQDGLAGCRAVADAGGVVLAQDEASSVVWGMPGAVAKAGLSQALLPPEGLAAAIRTIFGVSRGDAV